MTRFCSALTLAGILAVSITLPSSAQGISEYAGAQAASATAAAAAHKGAQSHADALQNLYGGATGAIQQATTSTQSSNAAASVAAPVQQVGPSAVDRELAPLFKEKLDEAGNPIPIDPRATVLTVGKMANKLFAEAQKQEKAGQLDAAEQDYLHAIALRNRFWGDNDPAVVKMYMLLGNIEMKKKQPASAESFFRRVLQVKLKTYGFGSYELVEYLDAMGNAMSAQKKYSEAANYYQQVKEMRDRKLGPNNRDTISAEVKLASAYAKHPDKSYLSDAEKILHGALSAAENLPDNKQQIIAILDVYQSVLRKQGKNAEADTVLTRLTDLRVPQLPLAPTKPPEAAGEPDSQGAKAGTVEKKTPAATKAPPPAAVPVAGLGSGSAEKK